MKRFEGRVSIVTGASQGIGETIARELAAEGAAVVLVDIQKDKLEAVARSIAESGGRAEARDADVCDPAAADRVAAAVAAAHGRIDHLVNNAGITRDTLLMRMKEEDWDAVLRVNLKGTFNFSRAVLRTMIGARYGRIVNIASVAGQMGNAGQTNYAASKAAVIAFAKSLAREVGSRAITVNAVAPGFIESAMTGALPEAVRKTYLDLIPLKKFGLPIDVANAVKFLLSDDAAYITGQVVSVNGGMYM
ncbi:MAG TPA: 3-oxoacyl-[acyl-carrier-protein] reductase [Candidatus Aminicenantes bacterium]|nr:3-oxoacyl-[acyl-carrier-protein] reductase [Candidatus Aminicenantes bacterium]HRY64147.1 3-oxoacyl-[acyl-carrier-protein] reductase [Candidatus Aminicenantes bacterium]HRZ71060.1 3-oxoacyl-[acyl-carrier-protein] reductase [Candidatus Aminicenantes bacterium]